MILKKNGILLGGIPTGLLVFSILSLAAFLCKMVDKHSENAKFNKMYEERQKMQEEDKNSSIMNDNKILDDSVTHR